MKLSKVLASVEDHAEKTASAAPAAGGTPTEKTASATATALTTALREVTDGLAPQEKQASAASPVGDLVKVASQMATAEHEATMKEAQLYGASVADGFMARVAQYNEAAEKIASQQGTKVAAAPVADTFEKFAAENPALTRQAAEVGYASTASQIEKLAEAARVKGHNQAIETIYKLGHDCFTRGFENTLRIIKESRQ